MAYTAEPRSAQIRVFLIDEWAVVRAGMRLLIDSWLISKVVGEADIIPHAILAMEAAKPDLIVFSHNRKSIDSLSNLGDLIKAGGKAPLVLLTSSRDPKLSAVAESAGARWITQKQETENDFRMALERAYLGEVGIHRFSAALRVSKNNQNGDLKLSLNGSLTGRERQVAELVSRGCTNRQVGDRLGITEVTVRHHLSSIFGKLGIANRFELIARAYERGSSN